jgi:hypothetical protein
MHELRDGVIEETVTSAEDQALYEVAGFIESGWQCFDTQTADLDAKERVRAAFYAGAGLALMSAEQFRAAAAIYGPNAPEHLTGLLVNEVNEYMADRGMKLVWTPAVPKKMRQ